MSNTQLHLQHIELQHFVCLLIHYHDDSKRPSCIYVVYIYVFVVIIFGEYMEKNREHIQYPTPAIK